MNLALIGNNLPNDFVVIDNHAQISQLKVAEITKTNQSTVSRWYAQTTVKHDLNLYGDYFSGYALKLFVTYLVFDAKRISKEVRNHNIKLLSDASDYGFQMLIDKMAGVSVNNEVTEPMKAFAQYCEVTDLIFQNTHIKAELVAGVKLSQAEKLLPHLANNLKDNRQLLVQSTASDSKLLTPSDLGKQLNISGQKVNKLLIELGLQVKNVNKKSRKDPAYLPTDKGHEFCSFTLATGHNGDTTTYQQLLWYESVLNVLM